MADRPLDLRHPSAARPAGHPAAVVPAPDGAEVLRLATLAHGGDDWANARTLVLEGHAVFYAPDSPTPSSKADAYRMWRVFDPARASAHAAEGRVRIIATAQGRLLFEENGVQLPADASAAGLRLRGTDRHGAPVYVTDSQNATCLIRREAPPR